MGPEPGLVEQAEGRKGQWCAGEIRHLVLCGIATSGVVLSTLREAADKDYQLTVLADLCADTDVEVHSVLTGKVFPRQARVISAAEWITSLV